MAGKGGDQRTDQPRRQLSWMSSVVVGSVLARHGGQWRVVRRVCRYRNGDLRSVTFAIRRCSWTHRAYTIYGYNDLIQLRFRMVPVVRRRIRSRLDRKIATAIHEPSWCKSLTCCDVEGVA